MQATGILEHLEELRKRLFKCLAAVLVGSVISFAFVGELRTLLTRPAGDLTLIYVKPAEALIANIRLAVMAGVILVLPLIIYQFLAFIVPGLYKKERRVLLPLVFFMVILFGAGVSFAYFVAFPFAITFFLKFATHDLQALFTITEYMAFVTKFIFSFGLVFQMPLLFLVLGRLNVVKPPFLRRNRKYVLLIIVVFAALITPPDAISQLIMAGPLLVLYEFGIILVAISQYRRNKAKKAATKGEGE